MASTATFYDEPDWEGSSGPIISRQVAVDYLWPVGAGSEIGGGDKDELEDGLHPFVAIGAKADRPTNLVGVVISYNADAELAQVNVASGFIAKAYVANVLTYSVGNPATFATSIYPGMPVFIDDSNLAAGVTLSLAPLNSAGSDNPLAGYVWYAQDEYADSGVGGLHSTAGLPKTVADELTYTLLNVMLYPGSGYGLR